VISATIDQTKDLPKSLSESGKIGVSSHDTKIHLLEAIDVDFSVLTQMPRKEIMKQIGSLFILRINWGGSILETPVSISLRIRSFPVCPLNRVTRCQEFFWSYPDLEPLYQAARSYLEIGTRIDLLNARVEVSSYDFFSVPEPWLKNTRRSLGPPRHAYPAQGERE
jgi:uncharacterized Rmd1/YagE family protein